MFYTNVEIAKFLEKIAVAYELKKKNRFRIIAYKNAADFIKNYPKPLEEIWQKDKKELDNVPGIGEAILKKLDYLFTHHKNPPKVQKLFNTIDPAIFVLTEIEGIGPKTAQKLVKEIKFPKNKLKIIKKLIKYLEKNNKTILLNNAKTYIGEVDRLPYDIANKIATDIIDYLKKKFPKYEIIALGSLRRKLPTIGDIDISVCASQSKDIIEYFVNYPQSYGTFDRGSKKASIKLKDNIRVDLTVQPKESWGSHLQAFTGSKKHNIELRRLALKKGLSISEYGIKDLKTGKLHQFTNEQDLYRFLDYPYPKPENR